ncbi:hypothetical protein GCM10023217_32580 [Gordonia alkaliphila]|uniref:Uncharacterized protein n=2 Tax=Gordonia alkaliphila TaxID=1053547 RepID=A0ABP8ZJ97_9ACTN
MRQQPAGFTESEYRVFSDLFVFWGERHAEIGATPAWSGIWPRIPGQFPAPEISARCSGGDPGYITRREGRAVRRYWIERGSLDSVGECGYFIDAMKFMAATLASDYRDAKGYEQLYLKLKGVMPDGVEVSIMDGREVYRLMGHDPDRYIPVYGVPGGISPYLLTHSLDQVNLEISSG